ncbi:hypothetical protein HZS_5915 [Henneguya salminicola]|nr:hypothetical protein HZS_5915 [Henneguya salminicola]
MNIITNRDKRVLSSRLWRLFFIILSVRTETGNYMTEDKYTLFIGNLPKDVRSKEIKHFFADFRIIHVEIRDSRTSDTCYGYLEFKHKSEAREALYDYDGKDFEGFRIRLDYKKSLDPKVGKHYHGTEERQKNITDYKNLCKIIGIPKNMSWRDLKTFLRYYCTSEFCDINNEGTGYVAFFTKNDMFYAIRKFASTSFPFNDRDVGIKLQRVKSKRKSTPRARSKSKSSD